MQAAQGKIKTRELLQTLKPKSDGGKKGSKKGKDKDVGAEDRLKLVMDQILLRFERLARSTNPNDSVKPIRETSYNSLLSLLEAISILLDLTKPDGLQEFLADLVNKYVPKLTETFKRLYKDLELPKPPALKKSKKPTFLVPATPPRASISRESIEEKENDDEEADDINIIKNELSKRRRAATNHFTSGLSNRNALFHSVASPKRKRTKTNATTYTPKFAKVEGEEEEDASEPSTKKPRVVVGEGPFATIVSPRRPSPMRTVRGRSSTPTATRGRGASSLRSLFMANKGS